MSTIFFLINGKIANPQQTNAAYLTGFYIGSVAKPLMETAGVIFMIFGYGELKETK